MVRKSHVPGPGAYSLKGALGSQYGAFAKDKKGKQFFSKSQIEVPGPGSYDHS